MRLLRWILIPVLAAVGAASATEVVRLSEPVLSDESSETFGAPLPADATTLTLGDVMAAPDDWVGKPVTFTARISQVCQKKGCFFIAADGDALVRVSFKDYSFFIPTDSSGKDVTFGGVLERVTVNAEQAEHFASDLGQSSDPSSDKPTPLETGPTYTIVASSIRIPR